MKISHFEGSIAYRGTGELNGSLSGSAYFTFLLLTIIMDSKH
jgi:hypothetical protein